MFYRSSLASVAVLAVMAPFHSMAATASASIDNISIRLFDLNFADAIAPSITWQTAENVLQVSGENVNLAQTFDSAQIVPGFLTNLTQSGSRPSVSATSTITGNSLSTSGAANVARTEFNGFVSTGHTSFNTGVLGAYSQLVFSATGFVNVDAYAYCRNGFTDCSFAEAKVYFQTSGLVAPQQTSAVVSSAIEGKPFGTIIGDSRSIQFSHVITNNTANPTNFQFLLRAEAYGAEFFPAIPMIPEPSTYLLMLLGGGAVVWRSRKSKVDS